MSANSVDCHLYPRLYFSQAIRALATSTQCAICTAMPIVQSGFEKKDLLAA